MVGYGRFGAYSERVAALPANLIPLPESWSSGRRGPPAGLRPVEPPAAQPQPAVAAVSTDRVRFSQCRAWPTCDFSFSSPARGS